MNFKREKIKDYFLQDTHVENIFINEYMVAAPGDYVKVYLFALMYAGYEGRMNNETISKHLNMEIEDVLKAWSYWDRLGVVKKHYTDKEDKLHYSIEFLDLKARFYGKTTAEKRNDSAGSDEVRELLENEEIRSMYQEIERVTGRLFEGKETEMILSWVTDYNASPEIVVYAYAYCKKKKDQCNVKYVAAVVKQWAGQGLKTVEQVEKLLAETDNRHYLYKRILKSLGFLRNPTEGEKSIIDNWFDQMNFDIDTVLEACKKTTGISNPNINYINSILTAWHSGRNRPESAGKSTISPSSSPSGKPNQISQVMKLYEQIRKKNEEEAEARREEIYGKVPKIKELDEEIRGCSMRISKAMLSGTSDAKNEIRNIRQKTENLNHEKAFLLTENNYRIDYMDVAYHCSLCRDTGTMDSGERCSCFNERLAQAQKQFEK